MSDWQDTLNYTRKFHDKLRRFCDPLVHHFGVNDFVFQKETKGGLSQGIGLNRNWITYYYAEGMYLLNPLSSHPNLHQEGVILVDDRIDQSAKKLLENASLKFGIHHKLIISVKVSDGTEFYTFGLTTSHALQIMKFFNEMSLIKAFIKEFKERFKTEILGMNDYGVDVRTLKGAAYQKLSFDLFPQPLEKHEFLNQIGIKPPENPLTKKEIAIVKYFLKGLSAPKIANELIISSRTVEHHLERIKDKLNCFTKAELIQKIQHFDSIGYLNLN